MKKNKQSVSIYPDEFLYKQLLESAKKEKRSLSAHILVLLEHALNNRVEHGNG